MKWVVRVLLSVLLFLGGCATAESSFQQAKQVDSVPAYQKFIARFPQHPLAVEARTRVDDLDYEAATKVNTIKGYEGFLGSHPESRHIEDAKRRLAAAEDEDFNNQVTIAIERGDYGQLIVMEEEARQNGYAMAAKSARTELDRFDVTTVGPGGFEIAASIADQKRLDSAQAVVRIGCAATTPWADELSALLKRNTMSAAISRSWREAYVDDFMGIFEDYAASIRSTKAPAVGEMLLYLFPETADDSVAFREGTLELVTTGLRTRQVRTRQDSSGFRVEMSTQYESQKIATLKSLRRGKQEDRVFSIIEGGGTEEQITYCSLIIIVRLPEREQLSTLDAEGTVWVMDTKDNSLSSVSVQSRSVPVLLSGSARLPRDRWITIGPGLSAKGGEVRFEETRVLLGEGTQIARRRP